MKSTTTVLSALLALGTGTQLVACGPALNPQNTNSTIDTVAIPQTPVEDQMKIGFCWAYTTIAFVESVYKSKTGKEVNLSEEALGFERMAEGLLYLAKQSSPATIDADFDEMGLEGWMIRSQDSMPDALDLVQKYGAVPESVWNHKFANRSEAEALLASVKSNFLSLAHLQGTQGLTLDTIVQKALLGAGGFKSAPPASFSVDGKTVTAKEYASQVLQFHSEDYGIVEASGSDGYARVVSATKRALGRGLSVPLGMGVNMDRLHNGRFSGAGVSTTSPDAFFREGGHAVLITDFVNVGGQKGAVDSATLKAELAKSPDALDYLVAKNSWGRNAQSNEKDVTLSGSPDGYYSLDQSFLKGEASLASNAQFAGIFSVVVPLDIANNPMSADAR